MSEISPSIFFGVMLLLLFASKYPFVAIIVFGAIICVLATEEQNIHQKMLDKKESTEKGEIENKFLTSSLMASPTATTTKQKYIHILLLFTKLIVVFIVIKHFEHDTNKQADIRRPRVHVLSPLETHSLNQIYLKC